jgi:hypothetical protein
MSELFSVYRITPAMRVVNRSPAQPKGILTKGWYEHPELGLCLFKSAISQRIPIPNVRNDWTEKVVYEISQLLGLPAARYELAIADDNEEIPGSVSINCLPLGAESIAGGDLLVSSIPNYQANYPFSYSVENALKSLELNDVGCPQSWTKIEGIERACDLFVGYLMLDALCSGVDRHSDNWEVMVIDGRLDLVPSFDHGMSLGGNLSESARKSIVSSNFDSDLLRSAFWENERRIEPIRAFEIAGRLYPQSEEIWLQQLQAIDLESIRGILDRIPITIITPNLTKFALTLFTFNYYKLLSQ